MVLCTKIATGSPGQQARHLSAEASSVGELVTFLQKASAVRTELGYRPFYDQSVQIDTECFAPRPPAMQRAASGRR